MSRHLSNNLLGSTVHRRRRLVPLAQFDFPAVFGDNLALAAGIVAFVMPPLIDAINRRTWSSEDKAIFAFVWCRLASPLLV